MSIHTARGYWAGRLTRAALVGACLFANRALGAQAGSAPADSAPPKPDPPAPAAVNHLETALAGFKRSEERRVGKESGTTWWRDSWRRKVQREEPTQNEKKQ